MSASLARKITSKLVQGNYIQKEQYDEYEYALKLIILVIITDITTMVIGLIMGMFWECVGFCFIYKFLRKYCGGYHFSTSLKCYLSTCVMCPGALIMIKHCPDNLWLLSSALLLSAIVLLILSPVEAVNKPLDEKEQKVFRIIATILVLLCAVCYSIFATLKFFTVAKVMVISVAFVALFAIIGSVHLKTMKEKRP